ncbi:hypothetical protein DPMN_082288 [Dreissena polymorpha]|uniref:Uncharacterized protein n=1 Tax=Dreissena polymorpha TaxID=45954 RepID=A0A9D3YAH1_DREPO|nr:hypothetical protein DPMN_082288 [Dreissena polymorpha]
MKCPRALIDNDRSINQVGPNYFKTAKKCEVVGVCCEGTGKQGRKRQFSSLTTAGQNKNNCVLWYALWRVSVGLHTRMRYSMMVTAAT